MENKLDRGNAYLPNLTHIRTALRRDPLAKVARAHPQ